MSAENARSNDDVWCRQSDPIVGSSDEISPPVVVSQVTCSLGHNGVPTERFSRHQIIGSRWAA